MDPSEIDELRRRALSDDPASRRHAADRVRELMEQEFELVFDATQPWALDPDARLREVSCLALQHRPEVTDEVRARRLIGRAELFLGDRSRSVADLATRRVLPYLLEMHPGIVKEWVQTWSENPEEGLRADLSAVFGQLAERFPAEAVEGLSELAVDPRPAVRAAVVESLKGLAARQPKMTPYLRSRFPDLLGE